MLARLVDEYAIYQNVRYAKKTLLEVVTREADLYDRLP